MSLKNCVRFTLAMAFVSLAALFLSHLALTDIYHGQVDPSAEWRMLQIAAGILVAFIASTVVTLRRVLQSVP